MSQYVALGSSFAAGLGLGPRDPGSPLTYMRSINGYPKHLARLLGYSLVDMTCSGATAQQILRGGPLLRGAQITGVARSTTLVTVTAGGNDVGYVRDLTLLGYQSRNSLVDWIMKSFWGGPKRVEARNFSLLESTFRQIIRETRRRAPLARIVVVTYPPLLPVTGICPALGITQTDAVLMTAVGERLAEVTRSAALATGATIVDMATIGIGHDACASVPWVNGNAPATGAPFHPTLAGAEATAREILRALTESVSSREAS